MGVISEALKDKGEIIEKVLEILEGKEARAKINLDGVKFHLGKSEVVMEGSVEFTFIPLEKRKK